METFGELITPGEAQNYFDAHSNVKEGNKSKKIPVENRTADENLKVAVADVYNSSEIDAFIFDVEKVKALFDMTDSENNKPKYLMVHFAAKYAPKKVGEPTIVMLGCNLNKSNNDYISMNNDTPALETPGTKAQPIFPPPAGKFQQIMFKIV